jgi:hypothetical protein
MEKKFVKICESAMSRYTRGGVLVGDYVEFIKGYRSHPEYKGLHDNIRNEIEELLKSGLKIRVTGINEYYPANFPGNPDLSNGKLSVRIAADQGGGRYMYSITVAPCLLSTIDFYPNLAPLPDQFNREDKITMAPEEVEKVDGGIKGGDYSLPTSNTTIKITGKKTKAQPYTVNYLKGLKA